eukprot:gene30146-35123_t
MDLDADETVITASGGLVISFTGPDHQITDGCNISPETPPLSFAFDSSVDHSRIRNHWSQSQPLATGFSYPLITPELDVINPYGHVFESDLLFCTNIDDYDDDAVMKKPRNSEDLIGILPSCVVPQGSLSFGTDLLTSPIGSRSNLGLSSKPNSSSNLRWGRNQSNNSLTNAWNQSNLRNQSIPRIQSTPSLTNPSLNFLEQRIISAHEITLNHKSSGSTSTRKSSGGTTTRKLSGGTSTRKLSVGTTTRQLASGTTTRKSSAGGTPTCKSLSGTASCKWQSGSGQVLVAGTGRILTSTRKSLGGFPTREWTSGSGQVPAAGTGRVRTSTVDSLSRLLGNSAVDSLRTPAYTMTDLEDCSVGKRS